MTTASLEPEPVPEKPQRKLQCGHEAADIDDGYAGWVVDEYNELHLTNCPDYPGAAA